MTNLTTALTNDEYRSTPHWSKSGLDNIHKSAALLEWNRNAPSDGSESVDLGTHVHCALLESEIFHKNYVKMPEYPLTTKAGREQSEAFKKSATGKIVLDAETYDTVIAMRDSVLAHPVANQLLTLSGVSEASIFSEIGGTKVKCRPDRIVDPVHFGPMLVDVKKTADIDKFIYSVRDFRYHVQAAFYSDIYKQYLKEQGQYNGEPVRFAFIVAGEKRSIGRHPVRVFELPQEVVDIGRTAYLEDLEKAKEFQEFGLGLEIEQLDMRGLIR